MWFRYDITAGTLTTASPNFSGGGWFPSVPILKNSFLWGTTRAGDTGYGTIYKLNPQTGFLDFRYLTSSTGAYPVSALVDGGTYLYGMTTGVNLNCGTIIRVDPLSFAITRRANIPCSASWYEEPDAGPLVPLNGFYYGTSSYSANVFEFNPVDDSIRIVATFDVGEFPGGGLTNVAGTLYGVARYPNSSTAGRVYRVDIANMTLVTVGSLTTLEGNRPVGELIANNGYLYGASRDEGQYGVGTIFKVAVGSGVATVLYPFKNFDRENGVEPRGGLTLKDGLLWGTTFFGGEFSDFGDFFDGGTLFTYNEATSAFTRQNSFVVCCLSETGIDGRHPRGPLTPIGSYLYGATYDGGYGGGGILYSTNRLPTFTAAAPINRTAGDSATTAPSGRLLTPRTPRRAWLSRAAMCRRTSRPRLLRIQSPAVP